MRFKTKTLFAFVALSAVAVLVWDSGFRRRPYSVKAATTGYGKPPAVGSEIELVVSIHDVDPTDPEVRHVVDAPVLATSDPNPNTTRCRDVTIELDVTRKQLRRIREYEHRRSFAFFP